MRADWSTRPFPHACCVDASEHLFTQSRNGRWVWYFVERCRASPRQLARIRFCPFCAELLSVARAAPPPGPFQLPDGRWVLNRVPNLPRGPDGKPVLAGHVLDDPLARAWDAMVRIIEEKTR